MRAQAGRSATRFGPRWLTALVVATTLIVGVSCGSLSSPASAATNSGGGNQAYAIVALARAAMKADHLRAVIVRVTVNNKPVVTTALGTSMDGVPATTSMHFRNGAVAFSYLATLLLEYVDAHRVALNDTIARWMPTVPEANQVTLKELANMTTGFPDYEKSDAFTSDFELNPFQNFTAPQLLRFAFSTPVLFPPGTNWSYSHTNMVILGLVLQKIGGKPLATLLRQKVLGPMGLTNTQGWLNAYIPSPVLHAYSSEQRPNLGIPASTPFYAESTFWSPTWGTPPGAAETTDITDMTRTAVEIGTGALLSKSSYKAMTGPNLLGFGTKEANCAPSCFTQVNPYNYGLGVVRSGSWLLQNPLLGGEGAVEAYLPSKKIAIAVAVTFAPGAFDDQGNYSNSSDTLFRQIGAYLAPNDAPPTH